MFSRQKTLFIILGILLSISFWTPDGMTASPIRIGVPLCLSGRGTQAGIPTKNTIEMVVDDLNKAGGINGRPVEAIFYDTETKEDTAVRMVNRLIKKDEVVAIVGINTSWEAMVVIPIVEKEKIPTIMGAASVHIVRPTRKWVFKTPADDRLVVSRILAHMKSKGIQQIALLTSLDSYGDGGRTETIAQAPSYGINIALDERFTGDETDLTPVINKVKKTNAQATFTYSSKRTPEVVMINYRQLGIELPLYMGNTLIFPATLQAAGENAEGVLTATFKFAGGKDLPDSDPHKKVILDYEATYKKRYGTETHQVAAAGYDAFKIMVNALKKAGDNKEKLRDAIEQTKGYVGVVGTFNYSPDDHNGLSIESMDMYQVIKGAAKLIR
jgi:branched-chain amino acid transport system substrate-binding protein